MSTSKKKRQASFSGNSDIQKPKNVDVRTRETDNEVKRLMDAAAKAGRHGHRDSTLILVTYLHGFRVSELTALRWDHVELDSRSLHVHRIKMDTPSVHPICGPAIRALRRLKREYPEAPYVFVTERKGPLTDSAVRKLSSRAGEAAKFEFPVHPHMLRHRKWLQGHDTRAIQQYLVHENIQHTVRYTELASTRFRDFWKN